MTIGSCYQRRQEAVIARSVRNLIIKFDLSKKPLDVGASEDFRTLYKATRRGGMASLQSTDMQRRLSYENSLVPRGSMSRRPAPLSTEKLSAIKAAHEPDKEEEDERIQRLTTGLLNKKEIGLIDHWSYKK